MTERLVDLRISRERASLWFVAALILFVLASVVWQYVGTFVLGLFLYYVTRPLYDRFERYVPSRTLAAGLSIVAVALPVLVLVGWTLVVTVRAIVDVFGPDALARYELALRPYLNVSALVSDAQREAAAALRDPASVLNADLQRRLAEALGSLVESIGVIANAGLHPSSSSSSSRSSSCATTTDSSRGRARRSHGRAASSTGTSSPSTTICTTSTSATSSTPCSRRRSPPPCSTC
jgi:predicted PurR-regulated permease PerM